MLNKELLLAQKQGLQDGEFLLTIGTADGAYGFMQDDHGSVSPKFLTLNGLQHTIFRIGANYVDQGYFNFTVAGEVKNAKKARFTYKHIALEAPFVYDSKMGWTTLTEDLPDNKTALEIMRDMSKNVGQTILCKFELL